LFRPEFACFGLPSHSATILQKSLLLIILAIILGTSIVKCSKIMAVIIVTAIVMMLRPHVYNCSSPSR